MIDRVAGHNSTSYQYWARTMAVASVKRLDIWRPRGLAGDEGLPGASERAFPDGLAWHLTASFDWRA